jgi:Hydrazine synthase alpha subunit middle domain
MGPVVRFRTVYWVTLLIGCAPVRGQGVVPIPYIYTETSRFDSSATLKGGERFPAGATLQVVAGGRKRALAAGFAASADATVSFDGQRVLFSGKQTPGDPWQIWEVPVGGGAVRRIVSLKEDAIAPFYLPGDRIVYSRRTPAGFQLVTAALDGGAPLQLSYGPGNRVACDVLRDGRVLFEAANELFTVYSDGSGVESYRCDHGPGRRDGRELASGDILFETGGRLARFTSARAVQLPVSVPQGEYAGPVAELSPDAWLVAYRPAAAAAFGLYRWKLGDAWPEKVLTPAGGAVQPVLVQSRPVPKRHPSALGDRQGANLLCLNVYTSKLQIAGGSVARVRVWAQSDGGAAPVTGVLLGEAPVEKDGSFFVNPPGETAIRFELLDRSGKIVAAEKGWFWARRGEQRVCVGCHAGPERAPENAVPQVLLRSTEPVRMLGGAGLPPASARVRAPGGVK